jgi:SAM-dependent methyltransferase
MRRDVAESTDRPEPDQYAAIADLYDHVVPYRERADVPFFIEEAKAAGGAVLELGCGTGRVLIPLARGGFWVTGLDVSPSMLSICRRRLAEEPDAVRAAVELVHADMRDFTLPGRFTLAILPFRSFQHLLTVEDQLACLRNVHTHLEAGGRIVIDVFNPSLEALATPKDGREIAGEQGFTTPDGRQVERRHRIIAHDRVNQVNETELIYYVTHPDGRTERLVHAFGMRYLFRYELEHLLARSGFRVENVYAGYDRAEYGSRYPGEIVMTARRSS